MLRKLCILLCALAACATVAAWAVSYVHPCGTELIYKAEQYEDWYTRRWSLSAGALRAGLTWRVPVASINKSESSSIGLLGFELRRRRTLSDRWWARQGSRKNSKRRRILPGPRDTSGTPIPLRELYGTHHIAIVLPLWMLFVLFAPWPTIALIRGPVRRWRRRRRGGCLECGYDLTGNESGVSPECGAKVCTV